MPIRAVAFDLDGTLVDSIPDLADAADAMLRDLGRPALGVDVVRTLVGKGMFVLVTRCLAVTAEPDERDVATAVAIFRRHYALLNGKRSLVYPGVVEGLRALRAMGLRLAVVTNKPGEFTAPLLEQLGLLPYFDLLVSGDTLSEKKPHPLPVQHVAQSFAIAPEQLLMVGDSLNDVQSARAAGSPVICVPYGYNEGLPVDKLAADALVSTVLEAAEWLKIQRLV